MIRTIIVDDEPLAITIIKEYLQKHDNFVVIQECHNGFEGVKAVMQHKPELIFLDIQMPKINGFEMLELLDESPDVIFTTAFDEYAIKAFEAKAVDYLLKPFSQERFDKSIKKWLEGRHNKQEGNNLQKLLKEAPGTPDENQRIVVRTGNNIRIIPVGEIHYLEAFDDYVKIHTIEDRFLKKKTMQHFEQILKQSQFVRVHRSYIVNVQEITSIEPMGKDSHIAVLKSRVRIPLSKSGYNKLKEALGMQ